MRLEVRPKIGTSDAIDSIAHFTVVRQALKMLDFLGARDGFSFPRPQPARQRASKPTMAHEESRPQICKNYNSCYIFDETHSIIRWHGRSPIITHFAFFAVWLFLMINDRAQSVGNFSELMPNISAPGCLCSGRVSPTHLV